MTERGSWGFTPTERRALLLICAAALMGVGYRYVLQTRIPPAAPFSAQDSAAIAAIAQAARAAQSETTSAEPNLKDAGIVNPTASDQKAEKTPIDINTAAAAELDALPGIGPVLARRIIQTREQLHGFRSPDELLEVPGIGARRLEQIKPFIACSHKK